MARIRSLKPEFWDSPGIESLDPYARLLYVAMWNWADDSGRGKAEPRELMGFAFPRDDDMTVADFRRFLGEVRRVFGVDFYKVDGRSYYVIPTWEKHQKIDKRSASRWPSPDQGEHYDPAINQPADLRERTDSWVLPESPPSPRRDEVAGTGEQGNRGTEEQGNRRAGAASPPTTRATSLPRDWNPTADHFARAKSDELDVEREAVKFRAHAEEKGRTAKNWNSAFTRWLMNAAEYAQRDSAKGVRSTDRQGDLLKAEMAAALAFDNAQDRLEINA